VAGHEDQGAPGEQPLDLQTVFESRGQGLFAKDMTASLRCPPDDFQMHVGWCANVDEVQAFGAEESLHTGVGPQRGDAGLQRR